ncbi:MAG: bifunctional precorrin-2 dehydrogenase/sirohydrochlorin ferrochelatase [Ignavibacteriaceae bacterium]
MRRNENSVFFPILINLHKLPCLVIGGGNVAFRKVTTLLNFKIKATIVAPNICKPLKELSKKNKIKIIRKSYHKDLLKNYEIIFCATDNPQINQAVSKDCKAENKLLNVADVPDLCDFILPAVVKRGDLTISVSSQGRAPFFAKEIKNKIDHIFPSYYEDIIDLAGNFRSVIMKNKKLNSFKIKEKAFTKFFMIDWKKALKSEGKKKANEYLRNIIRELHQ